MKVFFKLQKHFFKITMLLWFLFFSQIGFGQNMTQTIRGYVKDAYSLEPLHGATIYIPALDLGTVTVENGNFRMSQVPVGRYTIEVSFTGYEKLILTEILLESGKELVLEIELKSAASDLQEVVVRGTKPNPRENILPTAEIFTLEETLRFPTTFYDPARLSFSYAGVGAVNDQANHMVIRGNSPNNMSWRLEGLEIVNPNHLTNAGTSSDRPSARGGGVNILSAQMLGNSTLMKNIFPANYGNALSGIMDMSLRKGNDDKHEFTGQLGVIGTDLAAEGPINKSKGSSYLVNYRYSTLALLGLAGVDLGDEKIGYSDLAFHTTHPLKRGGQLRIFGMVGYSSNKFEAKPDSLREVEKDFRNISYTNKTVAIGMSYLKPISAKLFLENSIIFSSRRSDYIVYIENNDFIFNKLLVSDNTISKRVSGKSLFYFKNKEVQNFSFGVKYLCLKEGDRINRIFDSGIIRPFLDWKAKYSNWLFNLGMNVSYFDLTESISYEPRAVINYTINKKQSLGFSYGLSSQLFNDQVYIANSRGFGLPNFRNEDLDFAKSHSFSLFYKGQLNAKTHLKIEAYYQHLFNIPISKDTIDSYSTLNLFNDWDYRLLANEGTGTNYGLEISAQQYFSKNTFWLANVSLYESKYKGSDGIERDTRFNGNYIVNATYGREFPYSKKGKDYILGVNIRMNLTGGMRETPIANGLSKNKGRTVYIEEDAYSIKAKDSFKTDVRIYWKRNKKKFSSTLALDIQNVTNRKNPSFRYYDTYLDGIVQNYQLGLIPILSYRIEW